MTYLLSTMSIDRDTFENTSEDEPADLSVPDQVLGDRFRSRLTEYIINKRRNTLI